jgi:hypothetical protein
MRRCDERFGGAGLSAQHVAFTGHLSQPRAQIGMRDRCTDRVDTVELGVLAGAGRKVTENRMSAR